MRALAVLLCACLLPGLSATHLRAAAPVRVERCRIDYVPANMHGFSLTESVGPLHVTFTNESKKTASVVHFAVDLGGRVATVRDAGTFAPKVAIARLYNALNGTHSVLSPEVQPKCSVTFVRFTDGTFWRARPSRSPTGLPSPQARTR